MPQVRCERGDIDGGRAVGGSSAAMRGGFVGHLPLSEPGRPRPRLGDAMQARSARRYQGLKRHKSGRYSRPSFTHSPDWNCRKPTSHECAAARSSTRGRFIAGAHRLLRQACHVLTARRVVSRGRPVGWVASNGARMAVLRRSVTRSDRSSVPIPLRTRDAWEPGEIGRGRSRPVDRRSLPARRNSPRGNTF